MLDVVTLGEALIRYSVPPGRRLEEATSLDMAVAGSESNVAVAVSRMGRRAAWIGALPKNPLGRRVASELASHGVEARISWSDEHRMGTYYIEHAMPPRRTEVTYDRADSAAAHLDAEAVDWGSVRDARILHLSGITPGISDQGASLASRAVDEAGVGGTRVVVDVNYRARLWSPADAAAGIAPLAEAADTVLVTDEDARDLFGLTGEPDEVLAAVQDRFGAPRAVLTLGPSGSMWRDGDRSGHVPAFEVTVIDGIGAGDAFAAGVILGLLDDDLPGGVATGTAMAALVLGLEGDLFRFGPADVEALASGHDRGVGR